ncbi:ABC-2 transporter permease [Clostridium colicanis]|uniref:ABC-2 family transporter protein n=1 Tax=Clostridium colicanis DSM 13634 TaxID=1121305 RepID=A0A151ART5_9CLOT|nr:ABC-2 transporter permease [Clostridium colicanis]KYH30359.1 hypothetical protein CLCOL_03050 [Clostridium colicanis DSM 13634]
MINLIKKDLAIAFSKKNAAIFLAYCLFIITVIDTFSSDNIYILIISTIAYFLVSESFIYDERTKGEYIINSLPVKREEIVLSRYLSLIFYISAATVFAATIGALTALMNIGNIGFINMNVIKKVFISNIVMISLILPLFYKFGYRTIKIIYLLIYMLFFSFITSFPNIITLNFVKDLMTFIQTNKCLINILSIIILIFLVIISITISLQVYRKKDI